MKQQIRQQWRKLATIGTALLLAVAVFNVGPVVGQASASSCRWYNVGAGSETLDSSWQYYYTTVLTVPSWSACHDINITGSRVDYLSQGDASDQWVYYRVRFYPSSGGSYTNSWKLAQNSGNLVIAYNVLNGTRYRVEVVPHSGVMGMGGVFNHPAFSIFD